MTSMQLVDDDPIQLVSMEWDHGLEKSGILSLMHMTHFGCIAEGDMCVSNCGSTSMGDAYGWTIVFLSMST